MIIYNVTVTIKSEFASQWLQWITDTHAQEVLATGCFDSYELYQVLEHQEEDVETYAIKYITDSINRYELYISDYANALRDKGFDKFGNNFIAFRTLMKRLK